MGTITKALDLLAYFSPTRSEIGLAEFVRLSGRDKATVHRHLVELHANGFLEQDATSRAYRLGPALLRLAAVREAAFPVRKLLRPIVTDLADAVGELAHASLLEGDRLSPVVHADPRIHGTQVHFDQSETLPLHATSSGLAVLAFADPSLARRILSGPLAAHTRRTITDPALLAHKIEDVRRTGISQLVGAFDHEVASQGTAIFGETGCAIGAISIAVPIVRATPDRLQSIAAKLRRAGAEASRSLGGAVPDFPTSTAA